MPTTATRCCVADSKTHFEVQPTPGRGVHLLQVHTLLTQDALTSKNDRTRCRVSGWLSLPRSPATVLIGDREESTQPGDGVDHTCSK